MRGERLRVEGSNTFYFTGRPKHALYDVETNIIYIKNLATALSPPRRIRLSLA